MATLGIDPGLSGGMACIPVVPGLPIEAIAMPSNDGQLDLPEIIKWIKAHASHGDVVYIEKVWSRPDQGVSSMFKFGTGYGQIQGILAALGIPFILVAPQTWKKVILHDTQKDKAATIQFCKHYFPTVSLRASEKSKKDHDGIADALCIAEYGRRQQLGKL